MPDINISPNLVRFLEVSQGSKLDDIRAKDINEGKIDLLIGFVVTQNYGMDKGYLVGSAANPSQAIKKLTQITIQADDGENYTFSDNIDFKLSAPALNLNNSDLINRPKIIHVVNIIEFKEIFQDAARFGQRVACIYDRVKDLILSVSIESNQVVGVNSARSASCPQWGGCPPHD